MPNNRQTGGEFQLENGICLRSGLHVEEFLNAVQDAGLSESREMGNGYRWHTIKNVRFAEDRRSFSLSAGFREGHLFQAMLALSSPTYGSSWEDWTESKELRRKVDHDRFLAEYLGRDPDLKRSKPYPSITYVFPWGTVFSSYDPRSASSTIHISWERS